MKLVFRPMPGFSFFALFLFAALVALGVWQLERLQWKLGLIGQIERNMHSAPIPIEKALRRPADAVQHRRVTVVGTFLNGEESYVFAIGSRGEPVYHVLTPIRLRDGRLLIVDRGIVPPSLRDPAARPGGEPGGQQMVTGVLRTPDRPGIFSPSPDVAHRIWFARDLSAIAASLHLRLSSPFLVEADATSVPGGWPKGGQTVVNLPNKHLQYAVTWFLLAAALLVVYFAYHRARGRLVFGRD